MLSLIDLYYETMKQTTTQFEFESRPYFLNTKDSAKFFRIGLLTLYTYNNSGYSSLINPKAFCLPIIFAGMETRINKIIDAIEAGECSSVSVELKARSPPKRVKKSGQILVIVIDENDLLRKEKK